MELLDPLETELLTCVPVSGTKYFEFEWFIPQTGTAALKRPSPLGLYNSRLGDIWGQLLGIRLGCKFLDSSAVLKGRVNREDRPRKK